MKILIDNEIKPRILKNELKPTSKSKEEFVQQWMA